MLLFWIWCSRDLIIPWQLVIHFIYTTLFLTMKLFFTLFCCVLPWFKLVNQSSTHFFEAYKTTNIHYTDTWLDKLKLHSLAIISSICAFGLQLHMSSCSLTISRMMNLDEFQFKGRVPQQPTRTCLVRSCLKAKHGVFFHQQIRICFTPLKGAGCTG